MTDWIQARQNMVDGQVRTRDVTDRRLIDALLTVPRERFVPRERQALAYVDDDVLVSGGSPDAPPRFLMEPMPFARLVQLADIGPDDLVLDVGCATGYSAAVISHLAGSVVALEEHPDLAERAQTILAEIGVDNAAVVVGPLTEGYPAEAPYDVIILEGSVETVPDVLLDQLAEGGRLVGVVTDGTVGRATRYLRRAGTVGSGTSFDAAVAPLPGFRKKPQFVF